MITIKKLENLKPKSFDDIPNFTFFEKDLELFYKVAAVFEPFPSRTDDYTGPSWNAIKVSNGATYLLTNSTIVVMVDVTINYKTTDKYST